MMVIPGFCLLRRACLLLSLFLLWPSSYLLAAPLVIVNASVNIQTLSLKELRAIYTLRKRFWAEGQAISVFVLPNDHATHSAFCKQQLNVFPRQLESVWYRLVYTGTGQAPITVKNEKEMLEQIANTPGAIGYVEAINDETKTKILQIN